MSFWGPAYFQGLLPLVLGTTHQQVGMNGGILL